MWTARAVLPTPAMPSMAEMTSGRARVPPGPAARASSRSTSSRRPVKSGTAYGSSRGTTCSVGGSPAGCGSDSPRAEVSSRSRSAGSSPRAVASRATEDSRGRRRPDSSTLIAWVERPDCSASSSCVHPVEYRYCRSSVPKSPSTIASDEWSSAGTATAGNGPAPETRPPS